MGIDTLTTFINDKFKSWKGKAIVKQTLIIDGSAILNQLYDEIAQARRHNAILGADYFSFAKHIRYFFSTLKNREVRSLVVFEGIDVNLDKSATQDNRRKLDSEAVKETFKNPNSGTHLTPQLFYEVAIQTVEDIARKDNQEWVRYQIADGDADVTIARLGTLHHCPVLSNDSDFYVFPLEYGYIPYSRFHWLTPAIYADIYNYKWFARQFGIGDPRLLTLLPTIVGSDTISGLKQLTKSNYEKKLKRVDLPTNTCKKIEKVLDYAKNCINLEGAFKRANDYKDTAFSENLQKAKGYFLDQEV